MAWSIFSQGGGSGSAVTWAKDFLAELGAPDTPADEQFIYDWEKSEGGGGKYNPLNEGPVPGHPELTTTGSQYGGGAADYASWQAGLQGAVDYLNMSNYTAVRSALMQGNADAARTALIQSPWAASHYGYGASFASDPLPGQATALPGLTGPITGANAAQQTGNPLGGLLSGVFNPFQWILDALGIGSLKDLVERFGLIILGTLFILVGILRFTEGGQRAAKHAKQAFENGNPSTEPPGAPAKSSNSPVREVSSARKIGLRSAGSTISGAETAAAAAV